MTMTAKSPVEYSPVGVPPRLPRPARPHCKSVTTLHSYPFSATTGRELTTDAAVHAAAAADEYDDSDRHATRSFLQSPTALTP